MDNNASYRFCNLDIDVPFQNGVFHSGLYRFLNNFPLSPPFYVGISPSDTQAKMEFWDTVTRCVTVRALRMVFVQKRLLSILAQ